MSHPRLELLAAMVPAGRAVVDVGADHGYLAQRLGAIATERQPHRAGAVDVPWVIADGLRPFREVDVAVIAGMGAHTIARILSAGPRPATVVLHAQDNPPVLRAWLAANGWRIEAEGLAPEAGGFAEVLRAQPGVETATGLYLHYGPHLLRGVPHLREHLTHCRQRWAQIEGELPAEHPKRLVAREHLLFLEEQLSHLETSLSSR